MASRSTSTSSTPSTSKTSSRIDIRQLDVYNDAVLGYNTLIQTFPGVLVAGPFGFAQGEFFKVEETAQREAPAVGF